MKKDIKIIKGNIDIGQGLLIRIKNDCCSPEVGVVIT